MATYFSNLAWEVHWTGAWQSTVPEVAKTGTSWAYTQRVLYRCENFLTVSWKNIILSVLLHMFKPLKSVWKVDMTCHLRSDGLISSSVKVTLVVSDSTTPWSIYSPWNSPGQDTGVGSLSLLQGIFPTQGSNPGLLHCRQILYQLSHQGSPGILEGVVYPFSRGSSWPRNWTGVSCIAGGLFTNWAIIGTLCSMSQSRRLNLWRMTE